MLQLEMERAKYLLEKAFDEDGDENHEEAIELYMEAAEFCLALVGCLLLSEQRPPTFMYHYTLCIIRTHV